MPTLLITGAAGLVGTALRPLLRKDYRLRLLDRLPISDLAENEEAVQAELTDPQAIDAAVAGVDAILHLACAHGPGIAFNATLGPNYEGTLYLLEAARKHGVRRFVFASSHHVLGQYRCDQASTFDDLPVAPDSYYAMSKVFGEAACASFALRHNLAITVIRIGNADRKVADARRLRIWISERDLAQLVWIGLTHPDIRYEVVYGVSESPNPLFSNNRARTLGYCPQDHAQDFLAANYQTYEEMDPYTSGRDFVGGAYAATPFRSTLEVV